jgi:hypothetical protein
MAAFPLPPVGVYVDVGHEVEELAEFPQLPQLVVDGDEVEVGSDQDSQVTEAELVGITVTVV